MKILLNENQAIGIRRFEELLNYNRLEAELAAASSKERILEIAGSGRIDLLAYYIGHYDDTEAGFLKRVRQAAPGMKILCLVQDDVLELVRSLPFPPFDDYIAVPLNSGDLCGKIRSLQPAGDVPEPKPEPDPEPQQPPKLKVVVKVRKGRRFLRAAAKAAFILLLVFINLTAFLFVQSKFTGEAPNLFGRQLLSVLTGSMSPAIDAGSLILVRETEPEEITVGEIITYRGSTINAPLTTHRVQRIEKDGTGIRFITKGDRNNVSDALPISEERVLGVVEWDIPLLGYVFAYAQSRQGLLLLVILPALMVIAYALTNLFRRNTPAER